MGLERAEESGNQTTRTENSYPQKFGREMGKSVQKQILKDGTGVVVRYFGGTKIWTKRNYKDTSKTHGLSAEWYLNGQKEWEGNYKDGLRDGLWTEWYENGQKKSEKNYKDGRQDGLSTGWYENGQKRWESNYKDTVGLGWESGGMRMGRRSKPQTAAPKNPLSI